MDLKTQIQQLYQEFEPDLAAYSWASEEDRWAELVFCLLLQCSEQNPELTRSAVDVLRRLSLVDTGKMLPLSEAASEPHQIYAFVLRQHGFGPDEVAQACRLLAHVANVVHNNYEGKIQRYLRRHGNLMRDELAKMFDSTFLDQTRLSYAISHWLQNTLSLPISLQHQATLEFCKKHAIQLEDLLLAADELNLNVALVDDMLEMAQKTKPAATGDDIREEDR